MKLTVVIPTYNESKNLTALVTALLELPFDGLSVLVVDDNSPDGTGIVADQLAEENSDRMAVLHRKEKMGLGTAYLEGFRAALDKGAGAVAQMDADLSHPPGLLPEMMELLASCDLVIGSRYTIGGAVDRNWPYWRKALSAFGNSYARTILRVPVRDLTSGFKIWRSETLTRIPLRRVRSNGYAFQIEMTYLAYRMGCTIEEIPFYFPDRERGQSKMSFEIQREAAVRVWQLSSEYQDIHPREM